MPGVNVQRGAKVGCEYTEQFILVVLITALLVTTANLLRPSPVCEDKCAELATRQPRQCGDQEGPHGPGLQRLIALSRFGVQSSPVSMPK